MSDKKYHKDPNKIASLTPLQRKVTQSEGTEPPFQNEFWDNKEAGIYVDIVSGEPLFSSTDKYDSGTGWPSFFRPLVKENLTEHVDRGLFMTRTEVRSKFGDSHLGHVFPDGPKPTGLRYCMNSASMRFIPKDKLESEGYGEFKKLFETTATTAVLAGGCFWGMEDLFRKLPGVLDTEVGYVGGKLENPSYERVKTGSTGHAEALLISYDAKQLSYDDLLDFFFRIHDPTTENRQGNDIGTQYRSTIFVESEDQSQKARAAMVRAQKSGLWKKPIVTTVEKLEKFYAAEDYHQDYLEKNPGGYTCHWIRK